MSYTSTANDLVDSTGATKAHECAYVVLICNTEAFLGLLFAGMCAAILFGKINRVQSHAKIVFANAVCLQYEEVGVEGEVDEDDNETEENEEEEELEDVEEEKSDPDIATVPQDQDIENQVTTTDQTKVVSGRSCLTIGWMHRFTWLAMLIPVVSYLSNNSRSNLTDVQYSSSK